MTIATATCAAPENGWTGREQADVRASIAVKTQPDQHGQPSRMFAQGTAGIARIGRPNALSTSAVKTRSELPGFDLRLVGEGRRRRGYGQSGCSNRRGSDGSCPRTERALRGKSPLCILESAAHRQVRARNFGARRGRPCGPGEGFTQRLANAVRGPAPRFGDPLAPAARPSAAATAASQLPPTAARRLAPCRPSSSPTCARQPPH